MNDDTVDLPPAYDVVAEHKALMRAHRQMVRAWRRTNPATRSVSLRRISANRKLSNVTHVAVAGRPRKKIVPPKTGRASSLFLSIEATCSNSCPFKGRGCYVQAGANKKLVKRLDDAAEELSIDDAVAEGAAAVDGAFRRGVPQDGVKGGRDLRLFESGDAGSEAGARMLADSAHRWTQRGGGAVWGYTHWWREIPRAAFGVIHVAGSVETIDDADLAYEKGYLPALVVSKFEGDKPYKLDGSRNGLRLVPCPFETRGTTCVHCRLCLDRTPTNAVIGFQAHGPGKKKVVEQLIKVSALIGRSRERHGR